LHSLEEKSDGIAVSELWNIVYFAPIPTLCRYASSKHAYLDDRIQIVSRPTNRVLVLLGEGGNDRGSNDCVGIVRVTPNLP
jgi:hypothetical protein